MRSRIGGGLEEEKEEDEACVLTSPGLFVVVAARSRRSESGVEFQEYFDSAISEGMLQVAGQAVLATFEALEEAVRGTVVEWYADQASHAAAIRVFRQCGSR